MTKKELLAKLQNYIDLFSNYCENNSVSIIGIKIDHVCYKCESKEEYEKIREFFEYDDRFVYQSIISNRRISYIGLEYPLKSICGEVFCLELSDQKVDNSQESKCDHIELIVNGITYNEMFKRFSIDGLRVEENVKPHHSTYDIVFPNGLKIKMSHEPLVDKIYRDEMNS